MPRRTHPRSRHRHDRGHVRFHRDRVVKKRGELYRRRYWSTQGWIDGSLSEWEIERYYGPWGKLEDELAWVGCRRAGCNICQMDATERKRELRAWFAEDRAEALGA